MKIGFQGDYFSNSEEAAHKFAKMNLFQNVEFIPLITSKNVVQALETKKIDYAVMALKNKIAGEVEETKKVLTDKIKLIDTLSLPIHHSLFKKNPNAEIKLIVSHIQALHQTKKFREKYFMHTKEVICEDTATAAKKLYTGFFDDSYGVICRKNAGEFYHLTLIHENIEDDNKNTTLFGLFQLKI